MEKSQKGRFWGREIFKGKKYWRGVPAAKPGPLWVAFFRNFFRFFQKKIFFEIFSWVSVVIEVVVLLRVSCIEILVLRLFLGDFRWG